MAEGIFLVALAFVVTSLTGLGLFYWRLRREDRVFEQYLEQRYR